jgi:hypothetical protein
MLQYNITLTGLMENITFVHQELRRILQKYILIYAGVLTARDCALSGCLISAVALYLMARKGNNRYPSAMTKMTSTNEGEESQQ